MDINVNVLEEIDEKIGSVYHKRKKKNGKKSTAKLIHIDGDYGYIVVDKKINRIKLTLLEVKN